MGQGIVDVSQHGANALAFGARELRNRLEYGSGAGVLVHSKNFQGL
jgi:hypothetical protein